MKRIVVFLLSLVLLASPAALSSCFGDNNPASTNEEFKAAVSQMFKEADAEYAGLPEDARDAFEKKFYGTVVDYCSKVIKAYPDKEVAVAAFCTCEPYLDDNQFEKLYSKLSDANKEYPEVVSVKSNRAATRITAEGKMFVDFEVNGIRFSDFVGKGKYVLVDFWASWCAPCRAEIPNIKAVYEKYAGQDFDVLSIAVWDDPIKTATAAAVEGIKWNQIVNAQRIPTDLYGIQGIPQIMLFGPDGTILKRDLRGSEIEKAVSKALGK